jgi:hypothetical protein
MEYSCGFDKIPRTDVFRAPEVEDTVKAWLRIREGRMTMARYMVVFSEPVSLLP